MATLLRIRDGGRRAVKVAVIDQTGDKAGGAQLSLELFLRNVPPGIEPTAVFFEDGAYAKRIADAGIPTRILALGEGIRGVTREGGGLGALGRLPETIRPIVSTLRDLRPDVVYTNGIKAHMLGSLGARLVGIPSVVHHRDLLAGSARLAFLGVVATCSRERIATSQNVARCYGLGHTTIIDNPVELSTYRELPPRDAARAALGMAGDVPIAGIVGRINRWKGIDRFLRALAIVNERTALRGLIVGAPHFRDADLLPELHALRARLALDDVVTFVDWIEDTRDVYAAIDINANTSDREPFGRTIIEAAASGVPSVCFDDAGVSETMVDGTTGMVIPAHDERALAGALERYAANAEARTTAGAAARVWSERFDAALYGRRVADVLERAARRI